MDFIKSLFKFLLHLVLSTTALSGNPQYPYIEPIDIPKEVIESYGRLVDQNLFTNITDYLVNRARYVAMFYTEGDNFLIPEYAAVINFLIIEYLNNVHPRDGEDFSLERKIYSELLQDIENFKESALNNTETSKSSDHYPYNLKYSKVIDFLVRTALIGSEAMDIPEQRALFENLILNNATLNVNHFYVSDYYNKDSDSLGFNYTRSRLLYQNIESYNLLKNTFRPADWMLTNKRICETPESNNLFNMIFYFIHINQDILTFSDFRRTEGSHFLHIPSFNGLKKKIFIELWKYINHDLLHVTDFIHHSFPEELIIALNSDNKGTIIREYLEKETILQGSMWNSLNEVFQVPSFLKLTDETGGLESFIYWLFDKQHENTFGYAANFSPTSAKSILDFSEFFYDKYENDFQQQSISLRSFKNEVKIHFNKQITEKYPEYLSEHFPISKAP